MKAKKRRIITDKECIQAANELKCAAKYRNQCKTSYPFGFEYKKERVK